MAKRQRTGQGQRQQPARGAMPRWLLPAATIAIVLVVGAVLVVSSLPRGGQTAWARFDTADVHSLAFVGGDPDHILFGHHGGLLESRDGGRTWSALPVRDDAMSMAPADDGSFVIAGHEVFTASRDGGVTWASIPADLPSLDIHGFTRDPADRPGCGPTSQRAGCGRAPTSAPTGPRSEPTTSCSRWPSATGRRPGSWGRRERTRDEH